MKIYMYETELCNKNIVFNLLDCSIFLNFVIFINRAFDQGKKTSVRSFNKSKKCIKSFHKNRSIK